MKTGKGKKQSICICLVAILLILSVLPSAYAYALTGSEINPIRPIEFVPYSGFSSTFVTHMRNSVTQWNNAAGSTLMRISSSEQHDETFGYPNNDKRNYIYFIDVGADYLGQCSCWTTSTVITQVDININAYYTWSNGKQVDAYDFYSIFLHETGHAAGLGDLYDDADSSAVMYGYSSTNATKRTLTSDDKQGIKQIYG